VLVITAVMRLILQVYKILHYNEFVNYCCTLYTREYYTQRFTVIVELLIVNSAKKLVVKPRLLLSCRR